jgi:hypothetical protein
MALLEALASVALGPLASNALREPLPRSLRPTADAWTYAGSGAIRGITIGPIENARHPGRGYGTDASERAIDEAVRLGATWISVTPFGRVADLDPDGIDRSFEAPFEDNVAAVARVVDQAHARGLRVMLVPHLWVESGEWRALIDPKTDARWIAWASAYREFVLAWARVSAEAGVDLFSVGVEMRRWVTSRRVALLRPIVDDVRRVYPGLLTYSANWDDAEDTLIWDAVDLVGINAFYPLAEREGATLEELRRGGARVAEQLGAMARELGKPILLTEFGYTTRKDPALRPWEWPDGMAGVVVDQRAQADAYRALLEPLVAADWCAGVFVWRYYADPDDVSQEAEWGFSPRRKLAELVLRDAFVAHFATDGLALPGYLAGRHRARDPWRLGWDASPDLFADVGAYPLP